MDSISFSDEVVEIPMYCEICGEAAIFEGEEQELFTVTESGGELEEDEWYLHLFDEGLKIEEEEIVEGRLVALCPECAPENAIGGEELDEYMEEMSD